MPPSCGNGVRSLAIGRSAVVSGPPALKAALRRGYTRRRHGREATLKTYRAVIVGSGQVLLQRVVPAVGFWQRLRGLMLRRSLPAEEGVLFPDCRSVHTFLMRFPLDLAYLDAENRVVKLVEGLKPWRLSFCPAAEAVLEMNAGRAGDVGLSEGDRLALEPV